LRPVAFATAKMVVPGGFGVGLVPTVVCGAVTTREELAGMIVVVTIVAGPP
jgi:hypothetical protein